MIIKVCGIKEISQMWALDFLKVDYVGINFYEPSPRYYQGSALKNVHLGKIKKVGIFVNQSVEEIKQLVTEHDLDVAQLHGIQDADFSNEVSRFVDVIQAFPHTEVTNTDYLIKYKAAKYFLFDTATKDHGGSGKQFDWEILKQYQAKKPFLLAGGIKPDDIEELKKLESNKYFAGVDINSKFEIEPGNKDLNKIQTFIKNLNQ